MDHAADPSHPRYRSLLMRHRLEIAAKKGMLADSALIAHGRGEAYDYLIGEQTIESADFATKVALRCLKEAKHPVLSLNGNVVALAGDEMLQLADLLDCPVEVNIFYRTPERMTALLSDLDERNKRLGLGVEILGANPDAEIPGLKGPRAKCESKGILQSDVLLVPLEDGDRCQALVAMGKTVIVIDLNPLSRSSQTGTITIVNEVTRCIAEMVDGFDSDLPSRSDYVHEETLQAALDSIINGMKDRFKTVE
ncbi:MAG: phosphopantothenate/pantothenate synthetase [Candidatus Poseidoniaceae archaeon]|nr:phosphopantothenate/pantothenate synthetase [Candidatus Poseidoniaceae archaeon]MBL6889996.1 phosphopantothenate/pantothenate synthetase [Candidatus Poseidoniaceae archaeon]